MLISVALNYGPDEQSPQAVKVKKELGSTWKPLAAKLP
jgi:hypothetical protein